MALCWGQLHVCLSNELLLKYPGARLSTMQCCIQILIPQSNYRLVLAESTANDGVWVRLGYVIEIDGRVV